MPVYKDREKGNWYFAFRKVIKGVTYSKKKRGFKTKITAQLAEMECIKEIEHKNDVPEGKTVNEVYSMFYAKQKQSRKITTLQNYDFRYKNHIEPEFGSILISSIQPSQIIKWKEKVINKGIKEGRVNDVLSLFRMLFDYWIKQGGKIIPGVMNALESVKLFSIVEERPVWTMEEFKKFLSVFELEIPKEKDYHDYFLCFFSSGMRPNEFRALQRGDIQGDYLVVNKAITSKFGENDILIPPKNQTSVRKVLMPHELIELLNTRTKGYKKNEFIFGKEKAFRESNLRRELVKHAVAAELDPIPMHSFRHSHATHLIRSGVPIKVVSQRLGHSSVSTTLNIYTHVIKDDEQAVLDKLKI